MSIIQSFKVFKQVVREIGLLTIACTIALSANFAFGAWSNPPANPPANNVPAPLNVGSSGQVKDGVLDLTGLKITSGSPAVYLHDTSAGDLDARLITSADRLYFQHNVNDALAAPSWMSGLVLNPSANGGITYALFENQTRANAYCDRFGNNCIIPGSNVLNPENCAAGSSNRWNGSKWVCEVDDVGQGGSDLDGYLVAVEETCDFHGTRNPINNCTARCPAGYTAILGTISLKNVQSASQWVDTGDMNYSGRNAVGRILYGPLGDPGDQATGAAETRALCQRN